MTNDANAKKYDLEERTAKFGEEIIRFLKTLPKNTITEPLIKQLIRSATSIGANYGEADDAESSSDFKHKIGICKKRSKREKALVKNDCYCRTRIQRRLKKIMARSKRA